MKFKSVNELQNFSFRDCTISRFEILEDPALVRMELEALIVEPRNSQNTHFTQSYAACQVSSPSRASREGRLPLLQRGRKAPQRDSGRAYVFRGDRRPAGVP